MTTLPRAIGSIDVLRHMEVLATPRSAEHVGSRPRDRAPRPALR
jgi:hypothetical protein